MCAKLQLQWNVQVQVYEGIKANLQILIIKDKRTTTYKIF